MFLHKTIFFLVLFFTFFIHFDVESMEGGKKMRQVHITMGRWNEALLNNLIANGAKFNDNGKKIEYLSSHFLKTPYVENTLIGDRNRKEVFVINLEGMDCFTFIDYVEAMRLSSTYEEFKTNLLKVRYKDRAVDFLSRNHFFTDWREYGSWHVFDVTKEVGQKGTKTIKKALNFKWGRSVYIKGHPVVRRNITYIPRNMIGQSVADNLKTGDYMGVYSLKKGLDVSHVGIIIKKWDKTFFRNASNLRRNMKVVDAEFFSYVSKIPGIIILRPFNN